MVVALRGSRVRLGHKGPKGAQGPKGDPGTGFKLAPDGNFDIERKRLLNVEVLPDAKVSG